MSRRTRSPTTCGSRVAACWSRSCANGSKATRAPSTAGIIRRPNALGKGLVATATAPDGVIEAVEDPAKRFCLGVQWHPENFYRTGEFRALFEGLIKAASETAR